MKRKKLFVCLVAVLSLNALSFSAFLLNQESVNTVTNSTNIMICGDKTEPCPVHIHSVRPKYI